ncbi:MAG: glycosyl hydrolase, partial [Planctomycetota bacterium]
CSSNSLPPSFKKQFRALYRYTFDYLTHTRGLNNLLWVYDAKPSDKNELNLSHYPGDEYVDIVGYTMNWDSGPVAQPAHPYPKKVFACVELNVPTNLLWNTIRRDYSYLNKLNWGPRDGDLGTATDLR